MSRPRSRTEIFASFGRGEGLKGHVYSFRGGFWGGCHGFRLVDDSPQAQTFSRCRRRRATAIPFKEQFLHFLFWECVASDRYEAAQNIAHHLFQESVGADNPRDLFGSGKGLGSKPPQGSYGVADRGTRILERGEIVGAREKLCGPKHFRYIKGTHRPDKGTSLGQHIMRLCPEGVGVFFAPGVEPRVEGGFYIVGGADGHVLGQQGIERFLPGDMCSGFRDIAMTDLSQGVDTAIRAARPVDANRTLTEFTKGLLQTSLDSAFLGLELPPGKMGACVRDNELETGHGFCWLGCAWNVWIQA